MVPDLGDRANGRTRVARRALLVNGDRRREPINGINVGLLHLPKELTCVGREALNVASLALGVDRVEGEARLTRARDASNDDELVAWNVEVDPLEVVLAGAANGDLVLSHDYPLRFGRSPRRLITFGVTLGSQVRRRTGASATGG